VDPRRADGDGLEREGDRRERVSVSRRVRDNEEVRASASVRVWIRDRAGVGTAVGVVVARVRAPPVEDGARVVSRITIGGTSALG
jgi:hypothetical protein